MRYLWISLFLPLTAAATESPYFIVQNIASMTVRLYQKQCLKDHCEHIMILENPIIVGNNKPSEQSRLGTYSILGWRKFYVDYKEAYTAWNKSNRPPPGALRSQWHGGDFGFYAAILSGDLYGQHMHGTIGWGKDGRRFLEPKILVDKSVRRHGSHGCTRNDNQTISYLRNFVPAGTEVFKIYAIETLSDSRLKRYSKKTKTWDYIVYEGPDLKVNQPLDQINEKLLKPKSLIEKETYTLDTYPSIYPVRAVKDWIKTEINGNPYRLALEELSGVFYIDTGQISADYAHPKKLKKSGTSLFPSFFIKDKNE